MKNCPPCRGLWSPCERLSKPFTRALPSGHVPGSSSRTFETFLQVKYSDAVMGTSSLRSTGQTPRLSWMNASNFRHEYAVTRRTGTRDAPDCGHFPGLSSRTPSSPDELQTYDRAGRSFASVGFVATTRTSCNVMKSPS